MKERIQKAHHAKDLQMEPDREKDVDVLTAVGMTDRLSKVNLLGGLLYAIKGAATNKAGLYIPGSDRYQEDLRAAAATLSDCSRHHEAIRRLKPALRDRLSLLALLEWLLENCEKCTGSMFMKSGNGVMVQCDKCGGSGKRRFSDFERINILFELEISTYDADPERQKEAKAIRRRNRDKFFERLEKKYNTTCDRPMYVLHGFLGLAQKDKAATVAHMLERWQ
jgi:hypothetical protein